ncbi:MULTISPECIES: hypothetical protein [Flammeovirga]|uniref:Lipoprotein n=1 Tax=Flammeovirga agarivorans TaxID=2726742 RepID=A0A7X8SPC9_9BACT|nr:MULTISPECIES: hypothetical protein [Flammeovirga]NLR93867.1 hypothetical protein [Flammeovirga agarivorans]
MRKILLFGLSIVLLSSCGSDDLGPIGGIDKDDPIEGIPPTDGDGNGSDKDGDTDIGIRPPVVDPEAPEEPIDPDFGNPGGDDDIIVSPVIGTAKRISDDNLDLQVTLNNEIVPRTAERFESQKEVYYIYKGEKYIDRGFTGNTWEMISKTTRQVIYIDISNGNITRKL